MSWQEHQEPYREWQRQQENNSGPLLEPELDSLAGLGTWLSHPSNWKKTELFIVIWDGTVPSISSSHAWKMAPDCPDRVPLLQVILYERRCRKAKPKKEDGESND